MGVLEECSVLIAVGYDVDLCDGIMFGIDDSMVGANEDIDGASDGVSVGCSDSYASFCMEGFDVDEGDGVVISTDDVSMVGNSVSGSDNNRDGSVDGNSVEEDKKGDSAGFIEGLNTGTNVDSSIV